MNDLKLEAGVFQFEREIIGKNIHSVYTICDTCNSWGVNAPLNNKCGNCGDPNGKTYYDAQTIDNYIKSLSLAVAGKEL